MQNIELRKLSTISLSLFLLVLFSAVLSWAQDPGWPRQITKPGGKLVLYQPQVDDWKDYKQVDARMAFTLTPTGGKSHVGVVSVQTAVRSEHGRPHRLPQQSAGHENRFPIA